MQTGLLPEKRAVDPKPSFYKWLLVTNLIIGSLCLGWCSYLQLSRPKIAYVRSGVIIEKYLGMQEVRAAFQQKTSVWQSEMDTLQTGFQVALSTYETRKTTATANELQQWQAQLENQRYGVEKHQLALQEKAQLEESKLTEGVLNQVNSFVQTYSKAKGYTLVLGTTQSGSLLYGNEAVDITEEVINGLNTAYKK
jgi:outer membrane protein